MNCLTHFIKHKPLIISEECFISNVSNTILFLAARRKKYGYASKKYDPDMQPWLMRVGGKKDGKHYRGQREGGISENASYYVFLNQPGRAIGK